MSYTFYGDHRVTVYQSEKKAESTKKITKPRTRSSAKDSRNVAHQIFVDMKEHVQDNENDSFWVTKLDKWSRNKLDNKFKFNNNIITFTKNSAVPSTDKCELDPANVEGSYIKFKAFLEEQTREISDSDRKRNIEHERTEYNKAESSKTRSNKNVLNKVEHGPEIIDKYVAAFFSDKDVSSAVVNSLRNAIKLLLLSKNGKYIKLSPDNTHIVTVENIDLDDKGLYRCRIDLIKQSKNAKNAGGSVMDNILEFDDMEEEEDDVYDECLMPTNGGETAFRKYLTKISK